MAGHAERFGWRVVGAACAITCTVGLLGSPAWADPPTDLATVQTQVSQLEIEGAAAAEKVNGARADLQRSQERLSLFSRQVTSSRIELLQQQRTLELLARQLYVNGGVPGAVLSFSLDDPDQFLSSLDRLSTAGDAQNSVVQRARNEALSLKTTQAALAREQQRLADTTKVLGEQQAIADQRLAQSRALLAALQEQERQRIEAEALAAQQEAQRQAAVLLAQQEAERASLAAAAQASQVSGVPVADTVTRSERVNKVLSYALAQVGKPYVWGAPGPDAFDCSGLTSAAWAQVGLKITHYSGAQYAETTPVALTDLRPGDLLYFYSIDKHVGMYVGNGVFVQAANPRVGVVVSSLDTYWRGNLVAASRPA